MDPGRAATGEWTDQDIHPASFLGGRPDGMVAIDDGRIGRHLDHCKANPAGAEQGPLRLEAALAQIWA
jgi:hypothetical protein